MPDSLPEEKIAELRELLFSRRKIEAIKLYREFTHLGLKESKDAVEELEALLQKEAPEKFRAAPQGKGCFSAAAVLCLSAAGAIWWLSRG